MNFTKFTVLKERKGTGPKSPKIVGFWGQDFGLIMASEYHDSGFVGQGILQ
jgi:hypothetical protein